MTTRGNERARRYGLVDGPREIGRIHVEGGGIDVDEDRRRTDRSDRARRRREGEGRHEHRVALADAHRHQRDHQRVAAAGHGDRMLRAGIGGEALLQEIDLRAEDELAMVEDRVDARPDIAFQPRALALQIEEGDAAVGGDGEGCG